VIKSGLWPAAHWSRDTIQLQDTMPEFLVENMTKGDCVDDARMLPRSQRKGKNLMIMMMMNDEIHSRRNHPLWWQRPRVSDVL